MITLKNCILLGCDRLERGLVGGWAFVLVRGVRAVEPQWRDVN